jgi:cell division protease FtsH
MVDEQKDYGDKVADEIDREISVLIDQAYAEASEILTKNKAKLVQIAQRLIAEETLEGEKLEALFKELVPSSDQAANPPASREAQPQPDAAKGDSIGKGAIN